MVLIVWQTVGQLARHKRKKLAAESCDCWPSQYTEINKLVCRFLQSFVGLIPRTLIVHATYAHKSLQSLPPPPLWQWQATCRCRSRGRSHPESPPHQQPP